MVTKKNTEQKNKVNAFWPEFPLVFPWKPFFINKYFFNSMFGHAD